VRVSIDGDVRRAITRLYNSDEPITVARARSVIGDASYSDEEIEKTIRELIPNAPVEWGYDDGETVKTWLVDTLPW